jgi:transcriptional regulator with XRE-family HTH domain
MSALEGSDGVQRPSEYRNDQGELVRAHRLYTGLSQRTFAARIGIQERSLSDIEIGRRDCPPGFIDTVAKVVDDFDADVDMAIERSEALIADSGDDTGIVEVTVSLRSRDEWQRVVIGRAAVTSGVILPATPPFVPAE